MEAAVLVIASLTLVAAILAIFASSRFWFRPRIPIESGFLYNGQIEKELTVATGDTEKPIQIRFYNNSDFSLTNVVLDLKLKYPIALSGSPQAVPVIPNRTHQGRVPDKSYYHLFYYGLPFYAKESMDFRIELNTKGITPGRYEVVINIHTEQREHKTKKKTIFLKYQ